MSNPSLTQQPPLPSVEEFVDLVS